MSRSRNHNLPVESSWRMVEGENDSFDTSIVPEEEELVLSSNPSQFSGGSQGQLSMGGSQDDDIHNFLKKAENDEQVILRSPFPPTIPSTVRQSPRNNKHRSPDPEFYMPTVEVVSPRRTSGQSSRTIRQDDAGGVRQRHAYSNGSPMKKPRQGKWENRRVEAEQPAGVLDRISQSLPAAIYEVVGWMFGIVGLAFQYAQKPLAVLLAIYLFFGGIIIAQNMVTKSLYASMSPICRIPGASWLDLPFCDPIGNSREPKGAGGTKKPVEFDGLMNIQEQFEEVLEKSANGVSLPMEMKRSEASIRDLRTMVRYSNLQSKNELVLEFDGFIDTARSASNDLQKFNTHVGSAVDSVISINRWTSRYLDGLVSERESQGWVSDWTSWVFLPFQPTVFSERILLDKYVEHTALVSDKIADLIIEAQAVLRQLSKAEDHLGIIYDFVTRTQKSVQSRKDEILWTLWTLVGANTRSLHNLNGQLSLLRRVDTQRTDAVRQVSELIVELEKIQAGLGDLRDRVAEPEIVRGAGRNIHLSVHIETINRGVERLESARSRIRAEENERIREVLARGNREERLIDS